MPFEIFYGAKVNKSPALVRAAVQAGIGVDVSSLYEAGDALRAGADPTRLCATGPAKTRAFHKLLLDNASLISIDSLQELQDLDHCLQSAGAGQRARVLLRYRPHSLPTSRFGMNAGNLRAGLARLANPEARMVLEGFHFHLSGYAVEPRVQAVRELLPWVHEARRMGLNARMLDIGGGPSGMWTPPPTALFSQRRMARTTATARCPHRSTPMAGLWTPACGWSNCCARRARRA